MIWWIKSCVFVMATLLIIPSHSGDDRDFRTLLQKAQSGGTYLSPGQEELIQANILFKHLLKGEFEEEHQKKWEQLGFELREIHEGQTAYLMLTEHPSQKTGRGAYLFPKVNRGSHVLLQMPHSFKDLYTGEIGRELALEGTFAGAAWNTVSRNFTANGRHVNADFSRLFNTYFAALARAFIEQYPDGYLLQLHGYARENRKTRAGSQSDMIISTGTGFPGPWVQNMDSCLERAFAVNVGVYPLEVRELGATKTSIGVIHQHMGHQGFLHIEMSKAIRVMMRKNASSRKKLFTCIQKVLQ